MGLFDGFVASQQFGEGGGLLARLRAIQQEQDRYQPGAGFDQPASAPQSPLQSMPWPTLPDDGQALPNSQSATSNLSSQYQALLPVLGGHDAMLATVSPGDGKTMIAQALAGQQPDNGANVVQAGFRLGGIPFPFPFPPLAPVPPPRIPMPEIPDWMKVTGSILQLLQRKIISGLAGGGGDDDGCDKEIRNAREICTEAYANGWKSVNDAGPYKTRSGKPWTIQDCMRGFITERCGGNAVNNDGNKDDK
jgi:hypothetical protein